MFQRLTLAASVCAVMCLSACGADRVRFDDPGKLGEPCRSAAPFCDPGMTCQGGICMPATPGATPAPAPAPVCGNKVCEAGETNASCPADCPMQTCGNKVCDSAELCSTCPTDCGACPPVCGNGKCEAGETSATCLADCPASTSPKCGDGVCDTGEAGSPTEICRNDCQLRWCYTGRTAATTWGQAAWPTLPAGSWGAARDLPLDPATVCVGMAVPTTATTHVWVDATSKALGPLPVPERTKPGVWLGDTVPPSAIWLLGAPYTVPGYTSWTPDGSGYKVLLPKK